MNKERSINIWLIGSLSLFGILLGLTFFLPLNQYLRYWFFVFLFCMSIYLFAKSVIFKSDSSLYEGTIFFLGAIYGCFSVISNLNWLVNFSFIFLIFSFSHLIVFIIYKNFFHFFAFISFFLLFLPLILFAFNCINLLSMILLLILVLMLILFITFYL